MNPAMAAQYRNYSQTQRSPHAVVGSRRGIGPMQSAPQMSAPSQAQLNAQRQREAAAQEAAKQRAKKPTDKTLPDGVEECVVGEGVAEYKRMLEVERHLDAIMMRKRLELQERKPAKCGGLRKYRKLRVWISTAVDNQSWQGNDLEDNTFDFENGFQGLYRMKIEGRLIDDGDEEDEGDLENGEGGQSAAASDADAMDLDGNKSANKQPAASSRPRPKLSHFFKSISVEYDRSRTATIPEAPTIAEWKKPNVQPNLPNPPSSADFDCLEFERRSSDNINCTINLVRDDHPEYFTTSRELAEITDLDEGTRDECVDGVIEYVRAMGLQQDDEKRLIQCDARLKSAFEQETIFIPQIQDLVGKHLLPLPPIKLPYTIHVDPDFQASGPAQTVYDVLVPAPPRLQQKLTDLARLPTYISKLRSIAELDEQLALTVQAIANSKARHSFFSTMSSEPTSFVRHWVSSQKKDMEIILGDSRAGMGDDWMGEEFRRGGEGGVWGSDNVRESVNALVSRSK